MASRVSQAVNRKLHFFNEHVNSTRRLRTRFRSSDDTRIRRISSIRTRGDINAKRVENFVTAIMHARSVRFARTASRRWKTLTVPTEVTTGTKEIYSSFYISPKTRISDGRWRKAGLMNIQEQRSAELDSALVGARWERKKERKKNRMVSEGGSWRKKDAWRRKDRGWTRENALTLTRLICWELYILIFIPGTLSLTSFLFFLPSPSLPSLLFPCPCFSAHLTSSRDPSSNPAFFLLHPPRVSRSFPASLRLFTLVES